jgi:hypothetical protein
MKDWKQDTPFPRHWLVYVSVKIVILALAFYLAARSLGYL